jgi:hypothetical protein
MGARPNTRRVDRERKPVPPQPPRGAMRIVIPMTRPQYEGIWHDPERIRAFVDGWARSARERFPAGFDRSYCLYGFGREPPGLKLRKVVTDQRDSYWLRPGFVAGSTWPAPPTNWPTRCSWRPAASPHHRLDGKRYHEHWPHNLMDSTSLMGFKSPIPAIR